MRNADDRNDDGATAIDAAATLILGARHAVALTGAGVSTESGIPDFRSPGGLWERFDPWEYGTFTCFTRRPDKAWELFRELGRTLCDKAPNPAHVALAELETAGRLRGIVTQNIDGLHQAAGSRIVLEIHGNSRKLHCVRCGGETSFLPAHLEPGPVPSCARCGGALKPDVVLFEEPVRLLREIDDLLRACDLLLVVGTSAEVAPAGMLPDTVRRRGGAILEFNLERCVDADVHVAGPVGTSLPRVVRAVTGRGPGPDIPER